MNDPDPNTNLPERIEADREDIMREAVALRRRVSLSAAGLPQPIVAGFRSDGSFSLFLDQDPVYQFDPQARLRRAYRRGLLFRTQGATLAELTRQRTATQTVLQRRDLEPTDLADFLREMDDNLRAVLAFIQQREIQVLQTVPPDADLVPAVALELTRILESAERLAPSLPTRRS